MGGVKCPNLSETVLAEPLPTSAAASPRLEHFCLINRRPTQAHRTSLGLSLVYHTTLLALGNDLERIYQPTVAD